VVKYRPGYKTIFGILIGILAVEIIARDIKGIILTCVCLTIVSVILDRKEME